MAADGRSCAAAIHQATPKDLLEPRLSFLRRPPGHLSEPGASGFANARAVGAEFAMRMGHHLGALLGAAGNRSLWDDVRIVKTPARSHKRPDARPCTFLTIRIPTTRLGPRWPHFYRDVQRGRGLRRH